MEIENLCIKCGAPTPTGTGQLLCCPSCQLELDRAYDLAQEIAARILPPKGEVVELPGGLREYCALVLARLLLKPHGDVTPEDVAAAIARAAYVGYRLGQEHEQTKVPEAFTRAFE